VLALTALILDFRLFDSLGRRIAVIESETSVAALTDEEQKVHSSSRPASPLGERLSLLDTRAVPNIYRAVFLDGFGFRYSDFDRHWGGGHPPLSVLRIRLLRKITNLQEPPSGRLRRVKWAHDPVSSGFSLLVRCLLPLAT